MPSSSPNSRRTSSSLASRNFSGSSRADLLAPGGLQQSFSTTSNNSAARRALHENIDDHKENSTENGNGKGSAPGRTNQNQRGSSKKPWVTHFSKPATTLSPSNRVLVDRNSSCSPVRLGSIASGDGETHSDKKVARPTTQKGPEEASTTPGTGKGVAELSKRIQQFLDDQGVLLGVKTGSGLEVTSTCPTVSPVELGQHPSSSPYNPYKSPFFERPKFLRLNGNVSSTECADIVSASTDEVGMLMQPPTEELPLFEGDQVLVTHLQQIQFCTSLSPSSNEDEEVRIEQNAKEQMFRTVVAEEEASTDAVEVKALPNLEGEANYPHKGQEEEREEGAGKPPEEDNLTGSFQAVGQFQDGKMGRQAQDQVSMADIEAAAVADMAKQAQDQLSMPELEAEGVAANVAPGEDFPVCQDEDLNLLMSTTRTDAEVVTADGNDMSLAKRFLRVIFCGILLATFLTLVLLSSTSSGLLPPSLVDNPVNSFWQSSKYHEHSMMFVRGLNGLWSTEMTYLPADARLAVLRGAELYQTINELVNQAQMELQLYVQIASSIVDDWGRVPFQKISVSMNPESEKSHDDAARQFEWIQEYEFEEEWVDESPKLAYTDWELLHEYDLGAANQFVLGSIPDSLKNDLRRNFSRLSDSPEVRDLLEDLMKLKGGSTEEDRLEVLQYFWEYRRFSVSAHESLMKFQTTMMEDDSENQGFSTSPDHLNGEPDPEDADTHNYDQGQQTIQLTKNNEHIEDNHYQTTTEQHCGLLQDNEQYLDDLEVHLPDKMGTKEEQIVPEMSQTAPEKLEESMVDDNPVTLVSIAIKSEAEFSDSVLESEPTLSDSVPESEPTLSDSVHEMQREMENEDIGSMDTQIMPPTLDVNLDIAQLAALAAFIVASFVILGRNRESKKITKFVSHASSVQFLRKCDQPLNSLDDEAQRNKEPFADLKQDKKQVTMIEELNDRFESVLRSPEPLNLPLRNTHARKDEDLVRSPISTSTTSPYGSFTTYKLMSKKEGQATESKLTPVRRSSRIRNHVSMSPNANGVKRIAISPP